MFKYYKIWRLSKSVTLGLDSANNWVCSIYIVCRHLRSFQLSKIFKWRDFCFVIICNIPNTIWHLPFGSIWMLLESFSFDPCCLNRCSVKNQFSSTSLWTFSYQCSLQHPVEECCQEPLTLYFDSLYTSIRQFFIPNSLHLSTFAAV